MPDACWKIFDYTLQRVTPADVRDFAPQDPGYAGYVQAFLEILARRRLPDEDSFSLSETIGLTRWVNADAERDPTRFRRFRTFTNSVGMAMSAANMTEEAPNYFVIELIED